jgi:excinuclease ABC subunit A
VEFTTSFRHLKNLRVAIPTGAMTLVSGVSGAGKSTLIFTVLAQLIAAPPPASASSPVNSADHTDLPSSATSTSSAKREKPAESVPSAYGVLHERANIFEVITVDSSYLRGNKRSLVATVTDLLTPLRQLFASTTAAKAKGYKATRFSPNNAGGRCEACAGMGYLADPTQFGTTPCHICQGRRFRDEILEIRFKTLNFAEVLDLSIDQAAQLFKDFPPLQKKLQPLREVGLGYLRLGHPTTHCSAGEMQRLKLAAELQRIPERPCLYLFDEPARGLHQSDTLHLLQLMQRLLSQGHTIVVVEHQAAFRAAAHQIIEMGPSAGAQGGEIISTINRLNPQPRP